MTRDEQRTLLTRGEINVEGRVVGSSNHALLVSVTLDDVSALACYKSEAGERPLWDFPDGLWRREVAAYELDVQLGTDLVPTTIARDDAPFGPGSLPHAASESATPTTNIGKTLMLSPLCKLAADRGLPPLLLL